MSRSVSQPHDKKTSMFDFLFTSHDSLSAVVVVVSGEHFRTGDITYSMNANDDTSGSNV